MQKQTFEFAGHDLERIADMAGSATAYVYSREAIFQKINHTRKALPDSVRLHYSIKANPHPLLVAKIADHVDGLDVASHSEMLLALGSGVKPKHISFSGPGKSDVELTAAVATGIILHAESVNEIKRLIRIANRMDCTPQIAVRINPDFTVKQSGMVMGGGSQPFGIDLDQIDSALDLLRENGIPCVGLHCYAGSQMLNANLVCELHKQTLNMMLRIIEKHDLTNISLNLGGGFGVPYFSHEKPLDITTIGNNLGNILEHKSVKHRISSVILELGRYLVAEGGIYMARVVERKHSRGKQYLIVEGGMNHHLAATGNLGQAIRRNFPVVGSARSTKHAMTCSIVTLETVSIVGPLCTPLDILARDVQLPRLQPGDYIAVLNSGAYGYSASPHGFLSHSPPVEILI